MNMKTAPKYLLTITAATVTSFAVVEAATLTWDNGGIGSDLSTADNWNPNQAPAAGDTLNITNGDTVTHEDNLPGGGDP